MNRRDFFQKAAIGTAGTALISALARPEWLRGATTPRKANDVILLGPEKIRVARMAVGLGTLSGNVQREMGLQGGADHLKFAFDQGQFFWDTADAYKTHPHIKQALKSVPREKVTIMTKTDVHTAADMKSDLDRFRQELGTDYIDIVLLHGMRSPKWTDEFKPVMDVLSEAKAKGVIKCHGASIHSLEAMALAAKDPWCQVHLQGINHAGIRMDSTNPADVVAIFRQSKANGKGVLGMKILGEGRLRDRIDQTLHFVLNLDCLDAFTIGAGNPKELADLIKRIPNASVAA